MGATLAFPSGAALRCINRHARGRKRHGLIHLNILRSPRAQDFPLFIQE